MATTMNGILAGIRVLEYSSGLATALAAMMLAEAGAEVIKLSATGALPATAPGFAVANRSKKSVAVDLLSAEGLSHLDALLRSCALFIHDLPSEVTARLALSDLDLKAHYPQLVVVTLSGMPLGHTLAHLPLHDSLVLAAGGLFDFVHPASRKNGPVFVRFPMGTQCAAYLAACGAIVQLRNLKRGAVAAPVHTSLLQGAFIPLGMLCQRASQPTPGLESPPKNLINVLLECADGKWLHLMSPADHVPSVARAMGLIAPESRAQLCAELPPYMAHIPNFLVYRHIFKARNSAELLADLWAHDVAVESAEPVGTFFSDAQVLANGLIQEVNDPLLGPVLQPVVPYVTTPPSAIKHPRHLIGSDTQEVLDALATSDARPACVPSLELSKPLAGLRVLDLGNFLAGPLTTQLMAEMGATVVKLEATGGDPMRWAEWAFGSAARGKRSIAINLKDPASRPVIERLVRWADVVHHNLRMPAAAKLLLDYESLKKINPTIVNSHVNAYGASGPRKSWPGFDQMMQSASGWEVESAGLGNVPGWVRFGMTDHLAALSSLQATLLALFARDHTGEGQFTSASLLGATVMSLAEFVARPDGGLEPTAKLDKEQMGLTPAQRIYACNDGWVSVLAETPLAFQRLTQVAAVGHGDGLVRYFSKCSVDQVMALCSSAGVAVARVAMQSDGSLLDNMEFRSLGLVCCYQHPVYGRMEMLGQSWHFPGMEPQLDRPAPTLGQHTTEILTEMAFSSEEIASMLAAGLAVESMQVVGA